MHKRAVVLLSGGLDSSTVLYYAKNKGYKCFCLIFDYGQRHRKEIESAKKIAKKAGCPYQIIKFSLPWKGSSLIDKSKSIPQNATHNPKTLIKNLPSTYVPGRNTIFLSFALSYAETLLANAIFIGANCIDFSGYPDCRPAYFNEWRKLIKSLGQSVDILAPLVRLDKAQIVRLGTKLKVPYQLTWSCYKGVKKPCGTCDSCKFRSKGFEEAGVTDPLIG